MPGDWAANDERWLASHYAEAAYDPWPGANELPPPPHGGVAGPAGAAVAVVMRTRTEEDA